MHVYEVVCMHMCIFALAVIYVGYTNVCIHVCA